MENQASTGFNVRQASVLMDLGNYLKSLALQLVLMKITKLLNEDLSTCVTIDIITASPFLITNGLKQNCVIGQFLLNPYSTAMFKDPTKEVRHSQCKIFVGNMAKNHH